MKHEYDGRQMANWLIRRSNRHGQPISIMKALKLGCMAHGWSPGQDMWIGKPV